MNSVNIASHLTTLAGRQPSRTAIVSPSGDSQYTFRQLDDISTQIAGGFESIGIRRGMKVALMVPPSLDFFALTFGLFKLGAVPVLIDPGIGLRNLGQCLAEARPEAFIGIPKAHAARILFRWAKSTARIHVTVGASAWLGGHSLQQVMHLPEGKPPFTAIHPEPDEIAAILFTSGSTGPPKGVVYTHEIFNEQIEQVRRLYNIEPGEIDLPTFPLFALFGPALGMTEILPDMDPTRPAEVDPTKIIRAIERFGVTNLFGSPALINRVGRYGEAHGVKLPTLRRVLSAGAPVSSAALARFAKFLSPQAQVFTPYGATECLPVSSIGSHEILGETRQQTDLGKGVCVGQPVPGLTVRIIAITDQPISAWSTAHELPAGEIGEIVVQAPHTTRSYFNRPEATALAKIPDGSSFYHRMGDLGYLDSRGRIWFCGRKSQRVVTRQTTHFTIPCEAIFNTHPALFRTALVGVPRGDTLEPVLCVELEKDARSVNREKLLTELRALAEKHTHTRDIHTFLVHPAFPVDIRHNAKIFREKLALWASQQIL